MPQLSYIVVLGCTACTPFGGWAYFRRYQVSRPPIGVFTLTDLALMVLFIMLVPFLYLILPLWLAVLVLLAADSGATLLFGGGHNGFFAVNNAMLIVVIVGISSLWAQSGMKARDAAVLGAFLAVYDFVATSQLPVMSELLTRLAGLPLAPAIAWQSGRSVLGIGLGDLLLATVFRLVMRKAFGRQAGIVAMILALATIGVLLGLPLHGVFPVMVVLGPLMMLQYLFWSRRQGQEQTMWQYLQEERLRHRGQGLNPHQVE